MKLLLIDIAMLRPDHLGCYGYPRNTSPNIDGIAADGACFTDYYCSDAPCLPSRAAMFTGKFGIHTGVVGHGGTAADLRLEGAKRDFRDQCAAANLPAVLRNYGMYTASISTFPERHSAWWFNAGFQETHNLGKGGDEIAQEVTPVALKWLENNREREDWFLHVHYWDPHTQYRTPAEVGNPFEGQDSPALDWITPEIFKEHRKMAGFHSARDLTGLGEEVNPQCALRQLGHLDSLEDVRKNLDGYDCGIYNADLGVGQIIDKLKELGYYEDTAIIVTADHGEDMGELGRYSEHGCADDPVTRIPFIIKWPGGVRGGKKIGGLHYNLDLIPTLLELMGTEGIHFPYEWKMKEILGDNYQKILVKMMMNKYDGASFADSVLNGTEKGRDYLVMTCATHTVQRGVRFGDYLYIRTYHDGYCLFPEDMLFDLRKDPHETENLAEKMPEKLYEGAYLLEHWTTEQMKKNIVNSQIDPIWTVLAEGGPYHVKGKLPAYLHRLEDTGRAEAAELLKREYPAGQSPLKNLRFS